MTSGAKRLLCATLISPLAVFPAMLFYSLFLQFSRFSADGKVWTLEWIMELLVGLGYFSLFAAPIALGAVIVLGLPLHVVLSRRDLDSSWFYVAFGSAGAMVVPFILFRGWPGLLGGSLYVTCGAAVSWAFWYLAVRRNSFPSTSKDTS